MMIFSSRRFWLHTLTVLGIGVLFGVIIGLLAARSSQRARGKLPMDGRDTLRAAVCFRAGGADRLGYAVGLEYALLKRFGGEEGICMEILVNSPDSSDRWRELEDGRIDIVITDASDTAADYRERKAKLCLRSGNCFWAVRRHDNRLLFNLNQWLARFMETDEFRRLEAAHSRHCRMGTAKDTLTGPSSFISPYDDMIRRNARILGWDWRLLASLICQESKFVMSVVSPKNAVGLMQVRQVTADYYGVPLSFDPEDNIHLGTLHLSRIQTLFSSERFSQDEIIRFTIAAYNCGDRRIKECISYAVSHGYDPAVWEDMTAAMKEMKAGGLFNGTETLKSVQEVMSRYEVYRRTVKE